MSHRKGSRGQAHHRKPAHTHRTAAGERRAPGLRRWALPGVAGVIIAVIIVAIVLGTRSSGGSGGETRTASAGVGAPAPAGSFTTTSGERKSVFSLRGRPVLLWFVTTWCSSCQAGTQAMAAEIGKLASDHVKVVEVENAGDLGQQGPSITSFASKLAGHAAHNHDWIFGVASPSLTSAYNPSGYLDIYYLLDASGHIAYINSSPASTMEALLGEAATVGART